MCGAGSTASAAPASDLIAIELPRLQPPSAYEPSRNGLMAPSSDHDIDILAHAPGRRADGVWRVVDMTALAVSAAALVVDWGYTHSAAADNWGHGWCWHGHYLGRHEGGTAQWAIGRKPSTQAVDAYFAAWAVADVALWAVLPDRWRAIVPGMIIGVEVLPVIGNIRGDAPAFGEACSG